MKYVCLILAALKRDKGQFTVTCEMSPQGLWKYFFYVFFL